MKLFKYLLLLVFKVTCLFNLQIDAHGFGAQTFVQVISKGTDGWQTIDQLYNYDIDHLRVRSYQPKNLNRAYKPIKLAGASKTNCYMRLWFDNHPTHAITCTPSQGFYVTGAGWLAACQLRAGHLLFRDNQDGAGQDIAITRIEFIKKPCQVYIIEVDDYHTFLVGPQSILTHNMPLGLELFFGISVAFGEGAVAGGYAGSFFGPVTIGVGACILGLVGVGAYLLSGSNKPSYKLDFNEKLIEQLVNYNDNLGNQKSGSSENGSNLSCGSGDKGPDDDDDDPKISDSDANHMFRKKDGHISDTPENRKALTDLCSDKQNYLGPDSKGNKWFGKTLSDGKQLWAGVRGNKIRYGGLNEVPKTYNPITGLCKMIG